MKKLFYTLFVLVGLSSMSFAQDVASTTGANDLRKAKEEGVYTFTLPGKSTADIEKSAKYYTHYFTVDFNDATDVATVTMTENKSANRNVVARFLIASGMKQVAVDGTTISIDEFRSTYLQ